MLKAEKPLKTRLQCECKVSFPHRVYVSRDNGGTTYVSWSEQSNRLLVSEKNKSNNNQNVQLLRLSFIFKANYLTGISTKPCTVAATMQKTIRKVTCSLSRFTRSTEGTASLLSTTPTRYHSAQCGIWVSGNLLKKPLSVTLN